MTSISVIGTGYLGAVHAACMAERDRGAHVACVEDRLDGERIGPVSFDQFCHAIEDRDEPRGEFVLR